MLTVQDIIEIQGRLQSASYKTIDQFLYKHIGYNFQDEPYYSEVKGVLEATMVREELTHPAGYTCYMWNDRD